MKQFLSLMLAVALLSGCAGKSGDSNSAQSGADGVDSLSMKLGEMGGTNMGLVASTDTTRMKDFNRQEFLNGFKSVFANADINSESCVFGVEVAMQTLHEIENYKRQGITINRDQMLEAYERALMADYSNVNLKEANEKMSTLHSDILRLMGPVLAKNYTANIQKGEDFIKQAMSKDPALKRTESGLVYKVIRPGREPKYNEMSSAKVAFKGMHIDGTEFNNIPAQNVPLYNFVPGAVEALTMIGRGGKVYVISPAKLAYGEIGWYNTDEQGMFDKYVVEPNEYVIFEFETF